MSTFQLKSGADTLDFDIAGGVTKAGAAFGTWAVTTDNKIQVTPSAGATAAIPVDWGFNKNQLELRQGGNVIFNFHADTSVRPQIQVSKGTLVVAPNLAAPSCPPRGNDRGDRSWELGFGSWDFRPRSVGFAIDQVISARSLRSSSRSVRSPRMTYTTNTSSLAAL